MAIDGGIFIPIPGPLNLVMWAEFILFVPFSISHFCGSYKPDWSKLSTNPIGRTTLWSGEMLNGVGAWVLMYMLGAALYEGVISVIEIEILFLSHALWYATIISMSPPWPALFAPIAFNPHTYLYIGVIITGWGMPRLPCVVLSVFLLCFGLFRRWVQKPRDAWGMTHSELTVKEFRKAAEDAQLEGMVQYVDWVTKLFGSNDVDETTKPGSNDVDETTKLVDP